MKVILWLQRLIAVGVAIFGFLLMFSEVPVTESVWSQLFVTLGGLTIMLLGVAWIWLTGVEEKIVETR